MADAHTKPETTEPTTRRRRYTVGYISRRHAKRSGEFLYYSQSPGLHLKGDWLKDMGFETGQKVEVTSQPGQLVIRLAAEG